MNSFADVHEPERQRLPFRESLLAMLGIAFVTMLVALDQTIVGTAMPRIIAERKGSDLYAWVATSYMLASVITIPIFGRLGDLYGRKLFCSRPSCCSRWRPCYADPRAACCFPSLHAVCRASAAVSCSARYSPPSPISFPIRSCVFALARARHVDIRRSAPRSRARCSGISTKRASSAGFVSGDAVAQIVREPRFADRPCGRVSADRTACSCRPAGRRDDALGAHGARRVDSRRACRGRDGGVRRLVSRVVRARGASRVRRCETAGRLMPGRREPCTVSVFAFRHRAL